MRASLRSARTLPLTIRSDVERAVAEALNLGDLRRGVEALAPDSGRLPPGADEVDLVIAWVWLSYGGRWPARFTASDTFRALIDGCVIEAIRAIDL
jgi:hypothetical protein